MVDSFSNVATTQQRERIPTTGTMIDDISRLLGKSFRKVMSGTELEVAHKPCVYAWVREGQILYIGMSSYGYSRPLNPNHEKIKKYTLGEHDQIYFWAYDSPTEAYENEQRAIKHFKPELNYTVNPQKKIGVCDFCKEEFDKTGKGGKRFCSNKCRFAEWDRLHPRTKPLNIGIKIVN